MQTTQTIRIGSLRYWVSLLILNFKCLKPVREVRHYVTSKARQFALLRRTNKYSEERQSEVLNRFFSMFLFKKDLAIKRGKMAKLQFLVELSEETGIPQWELREQLKRRYHIDV